MATNPMSSFESLLKDLLDKPVKAGSCSAFEPTAVKPGVAAVYHDPDGKVAAVLTCPVQMGAYLGAALSMVPAATAESEAKKGTLSGNLLENFHEIANIVSQVVTESRGGTRCQLIKVLPKVVGSTPDCEPAWASKQRFDFELTIPNYGKGPVSLRLV
jgi:hypothetical protein